MISGEHEEKKLRRSSKRAASTREHTHEGVGRTAPPSTGLKWGFQRVGGNKKKRESGGAP